jgi:hypothetical protein
MEKLDLTKKYKAYFTAKTKPELVHIEHAQFISICGKGDPSDKPFAANIEALYSTAYTIKFQCKEKDKDFVVSKLEGLWWFDEKKFASQSIATAPTDIPRSEWEYRLLIRMPDFVSKKDIDKAKEAVIAKKGIQMAAAIEYFTMAEGKSVQVLHVGPFSKEPETLQQIAAFVEDKKLIKNGLHHEIYLSDFRKTAPNKLKTILREPVK